MTWRLHLSNQAIQQLHILNGDPALLAVWVRRDRVAYFDLNSGVAYSEPMPAPNPEGEGAAAFGELVSTLLAPNRVYLPQVRTARSTIYTTNDGQMRIHYRGDANLVLEIYGEEVRLDAQGAALFTAVDLDRFLGVIAALDESGKLHLFQQSIPVGVFDIGLRPNGDLQTGVVLAHGGQTIFATDGHTIVLVNNAGQVLKQTGVHYSIGRLTCSPDGKLVAAGDVETGVIRVYSGDDLMPTHQRFAIDMLAKARQIQLMAEMPPPSVSVSALALADDGTLAFAISGVICVSSIEVMDVLPRPQALL